MIDSIRYFLSQPEVLATWVMIDILCIAYLLWDLRNRNPEMMPVMRLVWILTVAYSGPIGLAIYHYSGRKQIRRDSLWRKGFRSVSHCYSGCGIGEIVGVIITVGVLSLGNWPVAITTFILAYVAGFILTMKPLMDDGESFGQAFKDAAYSETASITVMEIVAISVDLWLAGDATMGDILFWSSLVVSLSAGLVASYPANLILIKLGIKEGMHDPRHMAHHAHGHEHHTQEQPHEVQMSRSH